MLPRNTVAFCLFSSVAVGTLFAMPGEASACSPPPCYPAQARVAGTLPANGIVLPYVATSNAPSQTFRLFDPKNAEVPTVVQTDPWWSGGQLLVPSGLVTAGTGYHLGYDETCPVGGTGGGVSLPFDVGPTSALPSLMGTLKGTGRVVGQRNVSTSSGLCTTSIRAVQIEVRVVPSPELLAYAGIAGFRVSVDGNDAARIYYGAAKIDNNELVVTTIHAACDTRNASDDNGPSLGMHTIGVRAHVAGASGDPPEVTAQWKFSCTDDVEEVDGGTDAGDGGFVGTDSGTDSGARADGGAGADAGLGATPGDGESGCACTSAGGFSDNRSAPVFFLAAGLVVGLVAKRRSDRRRAMRHDAP